jgi:SnoaL-like domain
MPDDEIAIIKLVYEAFAVRDLGVLERLSSEAMVVHNAVTGSATGQPRYEGREALARYLADVDRVWTRLELRPQTFQATRPGRVLVAGVVMVERDGHSAELPAAWSWKLVGGKVTYVRVLPTAEAYQMLTAAPS